MESRDHGQSTLHEAHQDIEQAHESGTSMYRVGQSVTLLVCLGLYLQLRKACREVVRKQRSRWDPTLTDADAAIHFRRPVLEDTMEV